MCEFNGYKEGKVPSAWQMPSYDKCVQILYKMFVFTARYQFYDCRCVKIYGFFSDYLTMELKASLHEPFVFVERY
jgi:hypothetical protein